MENLNISEFICGRTLQRESLYGFERVGVLVENLNPVIEKNGLATSRLQADVEEELSKAGIPVLPRNEIGPTDLLLYININAYQLDELFFYSICIEAQQLVILARDPSIEMQATTWNVGSIGSVGLVNLYEIRGAIKSHVNEFIKDYKATSVN